MPNYTDVNSFDERGWLTLNIAPIGNETRYHSPGDELAALDHRTLQHMGDQTLALAEALASGPAPRGDGNRIFMDVSGWMLIALPLAAGAVLLVVLLFAFGWLAWRRGGIVKSAVIFAGTALLAAAATWAFVSLIGFARPGMFWRAFPIWAHLATYASVIFVGAMLIARVGRLTQVAQLRAGYWLMFLLFGGAIGLFAPGGIVYFIFPPLIVLIGVAVKRYWARSEAVAAILAIAFLYLTWGAMLALLEELISQGPMWLFAPFGDADHPSGADRGRAVDRLAGARRAALLERGPALSLGPHRRRPGLFRRPPAALRHRAHQRFRRAQGLLVGDQRPRAVARGLDRCDIGSGASSPTATASAG